MRTSLALGLALALVAAFPVHAQYSRTIQFSGYTWMVKSSSGRVGPGPNYFSDSTNNVFVDSTGRLHMRIIKSGNRWTCSEVILTSSFGNGVYRFYLDSPVDNFDPDVLLGLFTWNDDPAYNNRELDIEFSRWGSARNQNAQYVVQPYTIPANIVRWNEPPNLPQTVHSFFWALARVDFESWKGNTSVPDPGSGIMSHTFTSGIPVPGGEHARINLWLYQGRAPKNRQSVEVIISKFEYSQQP